MRIRILGSAAGGGLPQWNCGCPNCSAVRSGAVSIEPRTQDSVLVVAADGRAKYLLNASPDVARQIERTPELWPRSVRDTPLTGVILTNGDIDHCLGLLALRESEPFVVYATRAVQAGLREGNVLFRTLNRSPEHVGWQTLELDRPVALGDREGRPSGIELTPFAVPGKLPRHLEGVSHPSAGDTIGLLLREREAKLVYASCVARIEPSFESVARGSTLLFDGTFHSSDELSRHGIRGPRAEEMAHLPVAGEGGSLSRLAPLELVRRVYTHVNNTNPMLASDSAERAAVERAGWEVAFDGMEIEP